MRSFRPRFVVPACVALLALLGCGGNDNTCQDAANAATACASKLNETVNLTPELCSALGCGNKQGFINCVVALPCATAEATNAAFSQCLGANACR